MLPDFLADSGWVGVIATVCLPVVGVLARRVWKRVQKVREPFVPQTRGKKDHESYGLLLDRYGHFLSLLEDTIVIRAQVEAGRAPFTRELEHEFAQTRDDILDRLEKRGEREEDMGIFQKLDVLEGRMVGIAEGRKRRDALEARQAEIEAHPLFVKRSTPRAGGHEFVRNGAGQRRGGQNGA